MGHHLKKTTIITGTANEIGSRIGKFAMLVIIGEDKVQKELVSKADAAANDPTPPICVLWFQSRRELSKLVDDVALLDDSEKLLRVFRQDPDEVLAFAISYRGKVVDIIKTGDRINAFRVIEAINHATQD